LISWKDSFEKINNEFDMAKKKQNALEELLNNGRISQLTYENLNEALTREIEQIEARRKELAEKMTSKLNELEKQVNTLETFLANVEMSYAAGEITEELYNQEVNALNLGLEATKNELNFIREVIQQLVPQEVQEAQAEPTPLMEEAETTEVTPTETAMETEPTETEVEVASETEETVSEQLPEATVETPETIEATEATETTETFETLETTEPTEPTEPTETQEITEPPETPETTETLETPETSIETTTEETFSEEQPTAETLAEETQPFPEENPEESE